MIQDRKSRFEFDSGAPHFYRKTKGGSSDLQPRGGIVLGSRLGRSLNVDRLLLRYDLVKQLKCVVKGIIWDGIAKRCQ